MRELKLSGNALQSLPDNLFQPLTQLTLLLIGGNPGSGTFVPEVSIAVPVQTAMSGERVDLEAVAHAGPWGTNVDWSWAQTDSSGIDVSLTGRFSRTPHFIAPGLDSQTELTVEPSPHVTGVAITSRPFKGTTYLRGQTIEMTLAYSEAVTVTGTPSIRLQIGTDVRRADYDRTGCLRRRRWRLSSPTPEACSAQ